MNDDYRPVPDRIVELVDDGDRRIVDAIALQIARTLPFDFLAAQVAHSAANAARQRLDRRIADDAVKTAAGQLLLPLFGQQLPALIRAGDGSYVNWQHATVEQVDNHFEWVVETKEKELLIVTRQHERWIKSRDIATPGRALGAQVFDDTVCGICHQPWNDADLFEQAHDMPVAGRSGDPTVRWSHRSCNRSEGAR